MSTIKLQLEGVGEPLEVEIARAADAIGSFCEARIADRGIEFEQLVDTAARGCLLLGGRVVRYFATRDDNEITVWVGGRAYRFQLVQRTARRAGGAGSAAAASNQIIAPMPGTILQLNVQPGASFDAKEPLVVMESMKMEMSLTSPAPGRVDALHCTVGEMVERGALLATLELDGDPS